MANYNALLHSLLDYSKQLGIKVNFVPSEKLKDFAGMNPKIGKVMGFSIPAKTILIDEHLSLKDKYETLLHELYEYGLMRKGMKYWDAHLKSLAIEKQGRVSVPYKPCRKMKKAWPKLAMVRS